MYFQARHGQACEACVMCEALTGSDSQWISSPFLACFDHKEWMDSDLSVDWALRGPSQPWTLSSAGTFVLLQTRGSFDL